MAQPFDIKTARGNSVLSRIGGLPDFSSPQTEKALADRLQSHSNRVNYFKRMAQQSMNNGNQSSAQAYIDQAMAEYEKAQSIQDQLSYVQRTTAQRQRTDRNAQSRAEARSARNSPILSSIMESKPAQIGAMVGGEILRMFNDTTKGGGKALEYLEQSLKPNAENADQAFYNRDFTVSGDPESVMSPDQTINLKDVAKEIGVAGAKNAGTYVDALNSVRHWFMNNEWGSKPDIEDEKYRRMFGKGAREALGGRELRDPTVSRGADVVVDPLAVVPAVGRASSAVTDPKLWEGIARDMGQSARSQMFVPITMYEKGRQPKEQIVRSFMGDDPSGVSIERFEETYPKPIADAYKKFVQLKDQGLPPEEIFRQTRIFENVDGVPYFETDDSLAKLDVETLQKALDEGKSIKLRDVFSHPELDDRMLNAFGYREDNPMFKGKPSMISAQADEGASYDPTTGNLAMNPNYFDKHSGIYHELTHKFADDAGLSMSGSNLQMSRKLPDYILGKVRKDRVDWIANEIDDVSDKIAELRIKNANGIDDPDIQNEINRLRERKKNLEEESIAMSGTKYAEPYDYTDTYKAYMANNGEALARLAQQRINMTGEERANKFPIDRHYMKNAVGVYPEDTWFAKYDNLSVIPTYPKYMEDSARDYLRSYLDEFINMDNFIAPSPNVDVSYLMSLSNSSRKIKHSSNTK